jgi:defect-in-organelle-trafficking protein DotC
MKYLLISMAMFLTGCVSNNNTDLPAINQANTSSVNKSVEVTTLSETAKSKLKESLERNFDKDPIDESKVASLLRIKAISIDAYSWGIQEGVYYRTEVIQKLLEKHSNIVHKLISLGKFIVDGKMLMPTVVEVERIHVINSDASSTDINMSYTLDKKPRIVSQVPTWRDYLKRSVSVPEKPLNHALPKNKEEQVAWDKEFRRGWSGGIKQADTIYGNDLARMHSDIGGLYLYRNLLAQNIVSLPIISNVKTGVVLLDSGKTIYLNNVEHNIEMGSIFNDVNDWEPVFYQGDAHE